MTVDTGEQPHMTATINSRPTARNLTHIKYCGSHGILLLLVIVLLWRHHDAAKKSHPRRRRSRLHPRPLKKVTSAFTLTQSVR